MYAAEGGGEGSMNVLGPMGAGSGGGMSMIGPMEGGGAMNMLGGVVGDPGSGGAIGGPVAGVVGGTMNILRPAGTVTGSGGGAGGEGEGVGGLSEAERVAWARTLGSWQIWSCPVCHKKFGMRYYYERHLKCHKAEKEHECPYCPFRASYKWNLKSHIMNRHRDKQPPP